jgi:hypothetical protein
MITSVEMPDAELDELAYRLERLARDSRFQNISASVEEVRRELAVRQFSVSDEELEEYQEL